MGPDIGMLRPASGDPSLQVWANRGGVFRRGPKTTSDRRAAMGNDACAACHSHQGGRGCRGWHLQWA